MPGSRSRRAATRLVLPPPDGAASTNRHPDAGGALVGDGGASLIRGAPLAASATASVSGVPLSASFQILHLLAHLLDQHLHFERCLRELGVDGLRAQRVRLAVELLHQEVEALAGAAARDEHAPHFADVGT